MSVSLPSRIVAFGRRSARRAVKHGRQHLAHLFDPHVEKARPVFIAGCQRSGTNMLLKLFENSIHARTYPDDHRAVHENYRLRSFDHLRRAFDRSPTHVVVVKMLLDLQYSRDVLEAFQEARILWIYRSYMDVANSAARHWKTGQRRMIRSIAVHDDDWEAWYTERMSTGRRQMVRSHYEEEMSEFSAGALKWYLRNVLFFDLDLDARPDRVRLIAYEDLVRDPVSEARALFDFAGLPFGEHVVAHIHPHSVRRDPVRDIDPEIRWRCEELTERLVTADAVGRADSVELRPS